MRPEGLASVLVSDGTLPLLLLGVRPGDRLLVEVLEGERRTLELPVAATAQQFLGVGAYLQRAALNRLLRDGSAAEAYLTWLNTLEPRARRHVGLLFDGGFDLLLGGATFGFHRPLPEETVRSLCPARSAPAHRHEERHEREPSSKQRGRISRFEWFHEPLGVLSTSAHYRESV